MRLSQVIQADVAHMTFGKYTFFSAYASTANANMSPIAFAIMFGGETTENWVEFWSFAAKLHPSINHPMVTIISDQNPGCIAAVAKVVPQGAQHSRIVVRTRTLVFRTLRQSNIVSALSKGKEGKAIKS